MTILIEGSLEVKLPTIWTDGKAEVGRVREEKRRERRKKIRAEKEPEERRCRCAKGRKVAIHCVFPMICGSGGLKSRLAKAAGCGAIWPVARWEMKVGRRWSAMQISNSKCTKHGRFRALFGSWDVEKVHAVVARSTFPSQNIQNTSVPDHFSKLTRRKSVRRCGAKHISKSKAQKTDGYGALFGRSDVVSRGRRKGLCTDIWRGSVKMHLAWKVQYKRHTYQTC